MEPLTNRYAALAGVLLSTLAQGAVGQPMPPLTSTTPEYKCHVQSAVQGDTVISFYDRRELPARFSDAETLARAAIPSSVRARLSAIHECVLVSEQFTDPAAIALEQRVPQ